MDFFLSKIFLHSVTAPGAAISLGVLGGLTSLGDVIVYNLDIDTLITVLKNRRINGLLRSDLSTGGFSGSLGKGYAVITLQNGAFKSLAIYDARDQLLFQGNDALNKIRRKVLAWDLTETPPAPEQFSPRSDLPPTNSTGSLQYQPSFQDGTGRGSAPLPPMGIRNSINTLIPTRYLQLSPVYLQSMSRAARSIYALVNGINTVERIAHLLSLPVDVVYAELVAMQNGSFIVLMRG